MNTNQTHFRDGKVVLYNRGKTNIYQARLKIGKGKGSWQRFSTGETNLKLAGEVACKRFDRIQFRKEEGLTPTSKTFHNVATLCIKELEDEIEAGYGKPSYKWVISIVQNYLMPFFKNKKIDTVKYQDMVKLDVFRTEKAGRRLAKSTISKHNAALRKIFKLAVKNEWVMPHQIPLIENNGIISDKNVRPYFTKQEYGKLRTFMKGWCYNPEKRDGLGVKTKELRELLYDYVLFLANTGVRPGTEIANLKWKHISTGWKIDETTGKKKQFLKIKISGKTGRRTIVARNNTRFFLNNIAKRFDNLKNLSGRELYTVDEYVFRLSSGGSVNNLGRTFKRCLEECGMDKDSQGNSHVLYSLRHSYGTWALLDGIPIHLLAKQMGTSINMIEKHYSHVIPELQADLLAGWNATAPKKSNS